MNTNITNLEIEIEVGCKGKKELSNNKKIKLYEKALIRLLNENLYREDCIKIFYLSVKLTILTKEHKLRQQEIYNKKSTTNINLKENYHKKNNFYANIALKYGQYITPKEIIECFPITKTYDGDKYECKDYFNVLKEIKKYPLNDILEENLMNFLWDYYNPTICCFLVSYFCSIDYSLRKENKKGMLESFFDILDVEIDKYILNEKLNTITNVNTKETYYMSNNNKKIKFDFIIE